MNTHSSRRRACLTTLMSVSLLALCLIVAGAADVRWLAEPGKLVASSTNYEQTRSTAEHWEGVVSTPADPTIELSPFTVNAAKEKFLYIKLASDSGSSLQIFFSSGQPFSEEMSF